MDPATFISLSQVSGLMATFFQERRGRKEAQTQATIQEYIEWLERGRHIELVELLKSNQGLMNATERFMRAGHDEILDRFDQLEEMLAKSLISTPGWAEIIQSLSPQHQLSDQAIEVLRWFDDSGTTMAIEILNRGGIYLVPRESGETYEPSDPRFFRDDMDRLVSLNLLIFDQGSHGPVYTITRAAIELVKSFPNSIDDITDSPA